MKKTIAIVCLVLAAAVMGYWAMDGQHSGNLFEVQKVTMEEDEFGDKVEKKEWVKEFHLGLFDGALPAALGLVGVSVGLFFWDRKSGAAQG